MLNQTLSRQTFERLRQVLQQMAGRIGPDALLLTEELLITSRSKRLPEAEWFTLLVSHNFSTLLLGVSTAPGSTTGDAAQSPMAAGASLPTYCRASLTFEPEAIAFFLRRLEKLLKSKPALVETLVLGRSHLQPNNSALQSEFTLQVIAALDTCPAAVATPEECVQFCDQVQQQRDRLEQQVLTRTQELQDAMQSAQAANRAKSQFLAAVSHELRTPLTAIIGISSTLLRWSFGELSDRQRSFLQTIHDSGQRLLELINDILDLSQLEEGKTVLRLSQFSLSTLVQQTLKESQPSAVQKHLNLELDLRLDSRFDLFVADSPRLRQVLLNLLSNAIKFTPAGGTVTLRLYADSQSAIFQVKDTGIGIPEHQRSLLFQKFQQLDTSYRRVYQGTGLGLAIAKQLVELHGGRISVESTVGVGSVFTVQLPARNPDSGTITTLPEPSAEHSLGRILLIENHEESANIICDLLTAAGYQLIWMLEGSMAVHQIEILQPLVVITDIQSADSNGRELMRLIRQNPVTQSIKVMALVEGDRAQEGPHALELGADDYLIKPLQPDQVLPKVFLLTVDSTQSRSAE